VALDIGLIQIDDILQWKPQISGIPEIGTLLDLYDNSLTLKLITLKVVGCSAVSGFVRGEIHGLFYRYKTMGGSEYISDFLIGPETYNEQDPSTPMRKAREPTGPSPFTTATREPS
jgi:hypothetical protein